MVENSERFVGDIPAHYDRGLGPVLFAGYAEEMARRVAALAPRSVLETAAGTGILSRIVRNALPRDCELTVNDLNGDMVELARRKFGTAEGVHFDIGDATSLPYADASFDVLVCQFGIMFYPDQAASFHEARRVLRPTGRYVFSVWDEPRHNPFALVADDVLRAAFPQDTPPFMRVPFASHAIDPVKAMLDAAGLSDITVEVLGREQVVESWEGFSTALIFGNPVVDQIRGRGSISPEQLKREVCRALEARFGPSPATMPLRAIVYTAAGERH